MNLVFAPFVYRDNAKGTESLLTLRWSEMDSNHRSLLRASRFILRKVNCAGIDGAAKKLGGVPMVRIHLPPAGSPLRTCAAGQDRLPHGDSGGQPQPSRSLQLPGFSVAVGEMAAAVRRSGGETACARASGGNPIRRSSRSFPAGHECCRLGAPKRSALPPTPASTRRSKPFIDDDLDMQKQLV
jgi:hypothetical protein